VDVSARRRSKVRRHIPTRSVRRGGAAWCRAKFRLINRGG
jgi:hypothetical protein